MLLLYHYYYYYGIIIVVTNYMVLLYILLLRYYYSSNNFFSKNSTPNFAVTMRGSGGSGGLLSIRFLSFDCFPELFGFLLTKFGSFSALVFFIT